MYYVGRWLDIPIVYNTVILSITDKQLDRRIKDNFDHLRYTKNVRPI